MPEEKESSAETEEEAEAEQKEEEKKEEAAPEAAPVQKKSKIDEANDAAKRIEDATAAMKIENDRKEKIYEENLLAGKGEAGSKPKEQTEDEKYKEDAKKRYEGTGMDPTE